MSGVARPITLLIAALGGEGGGVLTNWIVRAAERQGLPVQSTSIPGVAQRTGATTYYVEIYPVPAAELNGRMPVLSLSPNAGDIDVLVASELLEAARAVAAGFVTKDRTRVMASTARQLLMPEKMAMGDGRLDGERLAKVVSDHARACWLFDMNSVAQAQGAMANAVMLGTLAALGDLPIPVETFEAAIRDDGKGVEANLRGFQAGLAAGRTPPADAKGEVKRPQAALAATQQLENEIAVAVPEAARAFAIEGVRRLARYQDAAYARRYLDRLGPVCHADAEAGAQGQLARECARHLALRMAYDDVIRVAAAKLDPERFARIAASTRLKPNETVAVYEVLAPGIEEICALLPPWLGRPLMRAAQRHGWLGRVHWAMNLNSTSITGYARLALLAKLKRLRPYGYRFAEEQRAIDGWLADVVAAASRSAALALEVVECARLIKGYGDTHHRGSDSFAAIKDRLIAPALTGRLAPAFATEAILNARVAALADPDGNRLAICLQAIDERRQAA
ncbi:MAG: indolepyruvate oxidoreductase subunit beta family protein [Xanthobacteraceae bacterium]|nr:MAG: indolepyruvate oxidoreductase subunit beta family protein [Xanthobacteraceae bacterium]